MSAPAACFGVFADPPALAAEIPYALSVIDSVRRAWPEMEGWVNFPLFNASGRADDLMLEMYAGPARATDHAAQMPMTSAVVQRLMDAGFAVKQARIAVLSPRSALRCHVDMYPADRLIMPLNAQGTDFRHVFGARCIAMAAGELWGVDGDTCHGAANIAAAGHRVALLVDADPVESTPPDWYTAPWRLPAARDVARPAWTPTDYGTEAAWHLAPFEFALTPEAAYDQLITWCAARGDHARAAFWRSRACVCVPVEAEIPAITPA